MNVTLILVQEDGSKRPVPLKKQRVVVGRKPECTIRVPVSSVSREHCEIVLEGDQLIVRDLGSSNGTYVNRERVQEASLKAGDILAVGPAVFVTTIDGVPAEVDAMSAYTSGKAPEPMEAAPSPAAAASRPRPAAPKPSAQPGAKPAPKPSSIDDELDGAGLSDSSISDFDFDFLNEDDEDKKSL